MTTSRPSLASQTPGSASASAAFIVAFPAFIAYQVLTQTGAIPPVLGGFGTAGATLALPFVLTSFYRQATTVGFSPSPVGALFGAYLLLFAGVVFLTDGQAPVRAITGPHAAYIFKFAVWYLIARSIPLGDVGFRRVATFALIAVIVLVLGTALARRSILPILHPLTAEGPPGDYQGAAMVFLAIGAFAIPPMALPGRLAAHLLAVTTLFFIGARSEFVGYLMLAAIVEVLKSRSRIVTVLTIAVCVLAVAVTWQGVEALTEGNRIFGLLSLANNESALLRAEMAIDGWRTVIENPTLGSYASYRPGEYAHSVLSAWVDLGVLGYFLLLCLILLPIVGLASAAATDSRRDDFIRSFALSAVVGLLMFVAKAHTYQLLAVSLGLYAQYAIDRRERLLSR